MNNICTSIEQSKKLLELGIDVNTADMYYQYFKSYSPSNGVTTGHCDIPIVGNWKEHHISIPDPAMPNADVPAWSLTALLELIMPKSTTPVYVDNVYQMVYDIKPYYITSKFDNPFDAVFEMVCWLKENGKI